MGNLKSEGLTAAELKMISEFVEALKNKTGNESSYDGQVRLSDFKDKNLFFQWVSAVEDEDEKNMKRYNKSTRYRKSIPICVVTDQKTSMDEKLKLFGDWKIIDHEAVEWKNVVGKNGVIKRIKTIEYWQEPQP